MKEGIFKEGIFPWTKYLNQPLDHLWNLYRLKRYELVEQELGKVLQIEPKRAEALALLALVVSALGRGKDALVHAVDALALDPENAWHYNILALVNVRHDNVFGAIECLLKAISLSPWSAEYYRFLSQCYSNTGQYEYAYWSVLKALELDAEDVKSLLQYGIIKYETRQAAEAEVILKHVLTLDPNNAEGHQYLGWLRLDEYETGAAYEHFKVSLQSQPNENSAEAGLIRAKELDSRVEAKLYFHVDRWLEEMDKPKAKTTGVARDQVLGELISRDSALYNEEPKPLTLSIPYSYEPSGTDKLLHIDGASLHHDGGMSEKTQLLVLKIIFTLLALGLIWYVISSRW